MKTLALNESGFIFDPTTGQTFTTNETGLEIIRLLKAGKSLEEVVASLEQQYDAGKDALYKDAAQFLSQMKTYRLIDEI
ncbi:MAG: HPr-rel-A system PqqD family peptide chaperone [Bacteroidota bacterium]